MDINLLASPTRVTTPFIKVQIGDYTFGIFSQGTGVKKDDFGSYQYTWFQYPNYIKSLKVTKINGQFNEYVLNIVYPITSSSDPNFFEKIFSSVSKSRKIIFSYGDASAPKFLYRNETAMITQVTNSFSQESSVISYVINAVSVGKLSTSSSYNFVSPQFTGRQQPSVIIKSLLKQNAKYGLLDIFTGMRNLSKVETLGLIPSDDLIVELEPKSNINILEYIQYLVSNMKNKSDNSIYQINVVDSTSDILDGCYFKISNVSQSSGSLDTYSIDIGYPSENIVTDFQINNNESFSILYDYDKELNTNDYVCRIDDSGNKAQIYSPNISSKNDEQISHSNDLNWWKNVTAFPISATISLKGVLRPTILMSKVKLSVLFYGKAHIASGQYIITKQVDNIDQSGCSTTLNLVRVGGDVDNYQNVV